jgi:hypothetical protein
VNSGDVGVDNFYLVGRSKVFRECKERLLARRKVRPCIER